MRQHQNLLLILGVAVLIALPLWSAQKPSSVPNGKTGEAFRGTDDQATEVISKVAHRYQPWFRSPLEPSSEANSSLLFALQAALGTGFIGYYLGVVTTRAKVRREQDRTEC